MSDPCDEGMMTLPVCPVDGLALRLEGLHMIGMVPDHSVLHAALVGQTFRTPLDAVGQGVAFLGVLGWAAYMMPR
jgi:hypothetical protein